ncbi:MAG: preprotein translocase subunit SecG [Microgenomates group bacterium ADurb.Bin219]|nr:MAG: preprotein translocase subunit SecG [Microgenomates group bacterium ADurb.Bin219]HNP89683.1 preprotein translocase subunit SecG [Candidatus Woesebacteria bacterium]
MKNLMTVVQIILSLLLIVLVILQPKGTGLGKSFGGQSNFLKRRGIDQAFFRLTIIIAVLFLISSLAQTLFF